MGYQYYEVPGVDDYLSPLRNFRPNLGPQGKADKKFLKNWRAGNDISSYGQFNTIRQQGAAQRAGIDMDYMTGANALISGAGGEQSNLINRMRELATEKQRQQEGMLLTGALADETGAASNRLQSAYFNKAGLDLDARRAALMGKLGANQLVKKEGWLDNLLKFSQAFSNFTGGANNAAQAGGFGGYG
jgi:hypothetical protein